MTEQPDTTAIRAKLSSQSMRTLAPRTIIRGLCDALDAARGDAKCDHGKWRCKWGSEQRDRAEAAEADLASERGEWNAMLNEANERYEEAEAELDAIRAAYRAKSLELARLREGTLAALYPNRYDEAQREGNYT